MEENDGTNGLPVYKPVWLCLRLSGEPLSCFNCLTDAALIDLNSAHDNASMTLPGHVYLTDFSSNTGPGGYTEEGSWEFYLHVWDVILT